VPNSASKAFVFLAATGLLLGAERKKTPELASIPSDPLELVTGQILNVQSDAGRAAVLQLLERARANYTLPSAGRPYDLKVSFTVTSGGQTRYDGVWKMEDMFDPKQGQRWTAQSPGDFTITRVYTKGRLYGEESDNYIPLRLQEARAALFDPLPSTPNLAHASIRTSTAIYDGTPVTCVLISGPENPASRATSRRWDETEECIDPQSGLLQTHSPAPGRYNAYDYSNASPFAGHLLPRRVKLTEAGQQITEITVDSLGDINAADANLFAPTEAMKERGRAIAMQGAEKIWRLAGRVRASRGHALDAVCIFGLVTSGGELVEAHSLQPGDPNSAAALAAARQINFSPRTALDAQPEQHFVFIIEEFPEAR